METEVILAILTSVISLILAIISVVGERRNARELEIFRSELTEAQAERDARRDYEYEARKRLYQEFEPLLFQFMELSENALDRIVGLARTAHQGDLDPGRSWLADDSYYMRSTIYRLMAPLVIAKVMQTRLTLMDLRLDPNIRMQYALIKVLYNSLNEAFTLAEQAPKLEYDPDSKVTNEQRRRAPSKYVRQGLFSMYLDMIVNNMTLQEGNNPPRCMNYGEFEQIYTDASSSAQPGIKQIRYLFQDFHPMLRPVLWRILIAQAHLYRALRNLADQSQPAFVLRDLSIPMEDRQVFDWRKPEHRVSDQEALVDPFAAAESYLRKRLAQKLPPDTPQ
jgi:hypothetical protein